MYPYLPCSHWGWLHWPVPGGGQGDTEVCPGSHGDVQRPEEATQEVCLPGTRNNGFLVTMDSSTTVNHDHL